MKPLTPEQQAQITYEDSTPDDQLTPRELKRKRNRAVKRKTRETEKQEKASQKQNEAAWKVQLKQRAEHEARDKVLDGLDDHHAFWALQRESLTAEQKAEYERVHEEMADWSLIMDSYNKGTDGTRPQDLADTIEEVKQLMLTTYTAPVELLLIPKFWTREWSAVFNRVAEQSEAARVFANYGYLLGPMANVYQTFRQKFITPRIPINVPSYVVMECTVCQKIGSRTNVLESIANAYKALNKPYKCGNCITSETNHMNAVVGYQSVVSKSTPFDKFGRVKDRDE
jgi:hypothetical protein